MRGDSVAMLAIVCLAAGACDLQSAPGAARPEGPQAFLFVRKPQGRALTNVEAQALLKQPAPAIDGSEKHPFPTISAALAAAPAGALVRIDAGVFAERLVVLRPVILLGRGSGKTRIVQPALTTGPAVEVRGGIRVELRGVSIEGGESGVAASPGSALRLENVALHGFSKAALVAHDAELMLASVSVVDVGQGQSGLGVELFGGSLRARNLVLRAAGRRALLLHKASAVLTDMDAEGSAVAALQAVDGSDARVVRGRFEHFGGAALYAGASKLTIDGAHLAWNEYGIIGYRDAVLSISDTELLDQGVAAIAMVHARGLVKRCRIARGGSDAAIAISEASGRVFLTENRIRNPGTMGVHITHSTVTARGNTITGAGLDKQNDLGDAFFALDADVSLDENVLRSNAGSGIAIMRTHLSLKDNGLLNNGRAGLLLLDSSMATATGNYFSENRGAAVELAEGAHATMRRNRFGSGSGLDIDIACTSRGIAEMEPGNTFPGPAARLRVCP